MARPIRILFEGAYYHVINRGQGKRNIFSDEKDRKKFLSILRETCETYHVQITAYCLMSNHYHLIVHTPNANLPTFMRQVNSVYTQNFNRKYKKDGPLFKGRYKALIAQEGSYLLRLIRYVHKNPVRAKIVNKLNEYPYSSHNNYLRQKENSWLNFVKTLKTQWKGTQDLKKAYIDFINKDDNELEDYLNDKKKKSLDAIVFGEEKYMDEIKMNYLHSARIYGDVPESKIIINDLCFKRVKQEIMKECAVNEENLFISVRGKENLPRLMMIGLLRECSAMTYKQIGSLLGINSYKSVAKYGERIKGRLKEDKELKEKFEMLKSKCKM